MRKLKLLVLFLLFFFPTCINAYGIENYYIDATIESDGDILVEEYFNLTGQFNGMERIIKYANDDLYEFDSEMPSFGGSSIHNGSGLEILEVKSVPINSNFSFDNVNGTLFNRVYSAEKGDYGVYEENLTNYGKSLLIYNPSSYNKAFYIKYRINNIAIRHNDVAEIGWNVIGNEFRESIGNFKLYFHIPGNTNVKAWAHGPINGNINIVNSETILVTISNLSSYRAIDVRATFDLNVISESTKYTNTNALDKIILYETDMAEQANYERQNKEKININTALNYLNRFEVNPTRHNYESALSAIDDINTIEVKNEYFQKLSEIKVTLDELEEKKARDSVDFALRYPEYIWYKDAQETVEILDNIEVKQELIEKLVIVEEKIKEAELKKEHYNYLFSGILLFIIMILGYFIYKIYRKDPMVQFNQKYFRDIPNDYSPETVSYLFYKKITNNSLSATLMDLIRKKIITAEKLKKNNYKLVVNEEYADTLIPTEEKLLNLIFHGKTKIETKDIKKYAEAHYSSYIQAWDSYHTVALNIAKGNLFYETDAKLKKKKMSQHTKNSLSIFLMLFIFSCIFPPLFIVTIIYGLYKLVKFIVSKFKDIYKFFSDSDIGFYKKCKKILFLAVLLIGAYISIKMFIANLVSQHFYKVSSILYILCFILFICLIPLLFTQKKRTEKGALEYKKWKALKNFLNDFGKFSDKEVYEVTLWEKYLVYATLFGCSKKVLKAMKVEFVDAPNDYFDTYTDLWIINHCITRSIHSSYVAARSAYNAANSSSSGGSFSSGSGGGGGFSSGGGSFGGGGGGGRF